MSWKSSLHFRKNAIAGQGIFEAMANYAPAFGMLGTLIGLINMLANIDDVE